MTVSKWDIIKLSNERYLDMSPNISEYIAVFEVLTLTVEGLSINSICMRLNYESDYVSQILQEFLEFDGWNYDLDYNPIELYESTDGKLMSFRELIKVVTPHDADTIDTAYKICLTYKYIEKEIDNYYGK